MQINTHANISYSDIENTRLVLNIVQVYPERLRKSKITRLAEMVFALNATVTLTLAFK